MVGRVISRDLMAWACINHFETLIQIESKSLGHPQPPTPIKTDNTTVVSFSEKNITQKRSKSWDIRYCWLRGKQEMQQFKLSWEQALQNLAVYFTKHFTAKHHKHIRSRYVFDNTDILRPARVCQSRQYVTVLYDVRISNDLKDPKTNHLFT